MEDSTKTAIGAGIGAYVGTKLANGENPLGEKIDVGILIYCFWLLPVAVLFLFFVEVLGIGGKAFDAGLDKFFGGVLILVLYSGFMAILGALYLPVKAMWENGDRGKAFFVFVFETILLHYFIGITFQGFFSSFYLIFSGIWMMIVSPF